MLSTPSLPAPTLQVTPGDPRSSPPVLVDTPSAFAKMMAVLTREPAIALDTESDSLYRYFYKVCLIQISSPQTDFLVDPLRVPDLTPLGALLADAGIEKIFHAAENDILMLKRDFGFAFAHVFDTMLAARILGWPQVSLAAVLEQRFGVTLDKRAQLTDWGQRPLSPAQLSYARLDSHYLIDLRTVLTAELQARKRWREAREAFNALPAILYTEKPFDPDGFWRMKAARDLSPSDLAILRELYLWRDEQARALDRPPFKVLSDDVLVQICQRQPQRLADLPLNARQVEHYGRPLLAAVARGRSAPPPTPPARHHNGNGRPDPVVLTRYDRLRAWRTQRAAERGVDADIVLANDTLMTIARAAPGDLTSLAALDVMGAWKLEEYGAALLHVLNTI